MILVHIDSIVTQGWPHEFLPIQYSVPVCESMPQPTTEITWLICQENTRNWIIQLNTYVLQAILVIFYFTRLPINYMQLSQYI